MPRSLRLRVALSCLALLLACSASPVAAETDLRLARLPEVLEAAHQGEDPVRRTEAFEELGRRLERRGIGAVHSAVSAPQLAVRVAAIRLIGSLGKHGRPGAGEAWGALDDPAAEVRAVAVASLAALGEDKPERGKRLIVLLEGDLSAGVRIEAARALGRFPSVRALALPPLLRTIETAPPELAAAATLGLRRLGRDARPLEPELRRLILQPKLELERRKLCVRVLGGLQGWGVGALFRASEIPELNAEALSELNGSTLGRTLLELFQVSTPVATSNLLDQLDVFEPEILKTVVEPLASLLRLGVHPLVRAKAASLLASLGPDARAARDSFGEALADSGAQVQALEGLSKLSEPDQLAALPWVEAALDRASDSFALDLLSYLRQATFLGGGGLKAIGQALQWGNDEVRRGAAKAYRGLGPRAAPAGPLLQQCLRLDSSPRVRYEAALALTAIGKEAGTPSAGAIRSLLSELPTGPQRAFLADALQRLEGE